MKCWFITGYPAWPEQLGVSLLPLGWDASLSQDIQHEVTRSITTPPLDGMLVYHRIPSMKQLGVSLLLPGWNASPSQGYPQQYVAGTHLFACVKRGNVEQSFVPTETTRQCRDQPSLKPPTLRSSERNSDWGQVIHGKVPYSHPHNPNPNPPYSHPYRLRVRGTKGHPTAPPLC